MKKSEMVKALADNFCHAYEIEIHAETIIDFLISQGMQPPKIEKWRELSGTILGEGLAIKAFEHEWEPEDEKK
jgi:hypothetical protein